MRKSHDYIILIFKGMAMLAAEFFPGISAASVAKLTGMYSEGVETLAMVSLRKTIKGVKTGRLTWWKRFNYSFVLALLIGVTLSIPSLTRLVYQLQMDTPVLIRAFMSGFLLITLYFTAKKIARWDIINTSALVVGLGISMLINSLSVQNPISFTLFYCVVAGFFSGCIFIIPGITILTVLQFFIIDKQCIDVLHILLYCITFAIGALLTARLITRIYRTFRNTSFAFLLGCIAGGFIRLWPWQMPQEQHVSLTNILPINNSLLIPSQYTQLIDDAQVIPAILLLFAGGCIAFVLHLLWKLEK